MPDTPPPTMCLFFLLRQHPPRGAGTRPSRRSLRALWAGGGGLTHSITKLRSEEGQRESWGHTVPKLLCPFGRLLADPTLSGPGTQTPGSQGSKCAGSGGGVRGCAPTAPVPPPPHRLTSPGLGLLPSEAPGSSSFQAGTAAAWPLPSGDTSSSEDQA